MKIRPPSAAPKIRAAANDVYLWKALGVLHDIRTEDADITSLYTLVDDPELGDPPDGTSRLYGWPKKAAWRVDEVETPKELASVIGNLAGFFVVDAALRDAIVQSCTNVEVLPLEIHDHDGTLLSRAYSVINVVGTHPVAIRTERDPNYPADVEPDPESWTVDKVSLAGAPPLFRPAEMPHHYLVVGALAEELSRFSNVVLTRLRVA